MTHSKNLLANYSPHYGTSKFDYIFFTCDNHRGGNVLNVLKAYKQVMEKLPLTTKLIIHQNTNDSANALDFIKENELFQHVMWMQNLSDQELAAYYKLSRFVINSSFEFDVKSFFAQTLLFEKPVIFTGNLEAHTLLKGEHELASLCLFDPYDYMDISKKMQWALEKTEHLYQMQAKIAVEFQCRTGEEFLDDYLQVLQGKQNHFSPVMLELEYADS